MLPTRRFSRRTALATGAVAALGLPALAAAQATPAASPVASPAAGSDLDDALTAFFEASGAPGAIVSIAVPGQNRHELALGVADLEAERPAAVDNAFRTGSASKTFTATATLQLVRDGAFGLDDPVGTFLPDLPNGDEITVRHLLSMQSGLFDLLKADGFLMGALQDPMRVWTPEELLAIGTAQPPDFAPGTSVAYSNTGYVALGILIEQVTGSTLDELFQERIFTPLGMEQTFVATEPEMPETALRGYVDPRLLAEPEDGTAAPLPPPLDATVFHPSVFWAGGAVVSTVGDLQIWADELFAGTLIGPELQEERMQFTPVPGSSSGMEYGLGIFRQDGVTGHDGSLFGYNTALFRAPSGETVVAVANMEPTVDGDGIAEALADIAFDHLLAAT